MILEIYLHFLMEDMEYLHEAKRTSISKVTRQAKIKRATGSLASAEARKKNDPLYKKMVFHKKKWKYYKAQVMKKYAPRVRTKARR